MPTIVGTTRGWRESIRVDQSLEHEPDQQVTEARSLVRQVLPQQQSADRSQAAAIDSDNWQRRDPSWRYGSRPFRPHPNRPPRPRCSALGIAGSDDLLQVQANDDHHNKDRRQQKRRRNPKRPDLCEQKFHACDPRPRGQALRHRQAQFRPNLESGDRSVSLQSGFGESRGTPPNGSWW